MTKLFFASPATQAAAGRSSAGASSLAVGGRDQLFFASPPAALAPPRLAPRRSQLEER